MSLRLLSRIRSPHGGSYDVADPLTRKTISGTTFEMLLNNGVAARQANSLPIGAEYEDEIEAQVCKHYPEECGYARPGVPRTASLNLWDVVRGSQVMIAHKSHGSQLVDEATAIARAEVCSRCPLNVEYSLPCNRCIDALKNVVSAITGNHHTPFDSQLKTCGVCSCYTAAHVWLPYSTLEHGLTDKMKEEFANISWCWKKPEPL